MTTTHRAHLRATTGGPTDAAAPGAAVGTVDPADRFDRLSVALVAVVCVPIVVALVRALAGGWEPVGDNGILALRIQDVGGEHHPLLGPWSSSSLTLGVDVNHPGPWYFYLAAPFVRIWGTSVGVPLAVAALNIASVVGISFAARALGGPRCERWMLAATAGLVWLMGSELLVDLWSPHVVMLPMLLFLVVASLVGSGRSGALPVLVGVTSLIVQTQLSHAYVLLIIGGASIASGFVAHRRASAGTGPWSSRRTSVATLAVVLVAWLPPLIEQFANGRSGNLWRLGASVGAGELVVGPEGAIRMVARVFAIPPFWSRGSLVDGLDGVQRVADPDGVSLEVAGLPSLWVSILALAVLFGVVGLLWTRARRSGRVAEQAALAMVLATIVAALAAVAALVVGPVGFAPHHVRWVFVLAVFGHAVIAWTATEWLRRRSGRSDAVDLVPVVVLCLFAVAALPAHVHESGPIVDRSARPAIARLGDQLAALDLPEPLVYEHFDVRPFEPYSGPVMMHLADLGVDVRAGGSLPRQYGEGRRATGDEVAVLYQRSGPEALVSDRGDCRIALADAVDADERERLVAALDAIVARLLAGEVDFDDDLLRSEPRYLDVVGEIASGDEADVRWTVLDGTLIPWARAGALDPETAALLDEYGEDLVDWGYGAVALFLRTDLPCPEPSR